jgi:hypothetical protein
MGMETVETPKADGLKTALDTIVAPGEAFERLRSAPTWGWAYLITLVLYMLGSFLLIPAIVHGTQAGWAAQVAENPRLAALSPDQLRNALNISITVVRFAWLFPLIVLPLYILIQTIVLLVFKAIGRGDAGFGQIWAAVTNITVPTLGIGAVVLALIAIVRGADSFGTSFEVQTAMPSLAMLAPGAPVKLHGFLAAFTPFTLWGAWLMATAMSVTARVPKGVAYAAGATVLLIGALFTMLGAR